MTNLHGKNLKPGQQKFKNVAVIQSYSSVFIMALSC